MTERQIDPVQNWIAVIDSRRTRRAAAGYRQPNPTQPIMDSTALPRQFPGRRNTFNRKYRPAAQVGAPTRAAHRHAAVAGANYFRVAPCRHRLHGSEAWCLDGLDFSGRERGDAGFVPSGLKRLRRSLPGGIFSMTAQRARFSSMVKGAVRGSNSIRGDGSWPSLIPADTERGRIERIVVDARPCVALNNRFATPILKRLRSLNRRQTLQSARARLTTMPGRNSEGATQTRREQPARHAWIVAAIVRIERCNMNSRAAAKEQDATSEIIFRRKFSQPGVHRRLRKQAQQDSKGHRDRWLQVTVRHRQP